MDTARVIVYQQNYRWSVCLQQLLGDLADKLCLTSGWEDLTTRLTAWPASFVAIEARIDQPYEVLRHIRFFSDRFPHATPIALLNATDRLWEDALREAGACYLATSPLRLAAVARMARAKLQTMPQSNRNLLERIEAGLPWGE